MLETVGTVRIAGLAGLSDPDGTTAEWKLNLIYRNINM